MKVLEVREDGRKRKCGDKFVQIILEHCPDRAEKIAMREKHLEYARNNMSYTEKVQSLG